MILVEDGASVTFCSYLEAPKMEGISCINAISSPNCVSDRDSSSEAKPLPVFIKREKVKTATRMCRHGEFFIAILQEKDSFIIKAPLPLKTYGNRQQMPIDSISE
ncbi:MAG: hypothetical protein JRH15_20535 [Deltaproteobacteria bacterium]|nr:hypothetical protein [Deltaproteobacteria bacterium]